MQTWAQTHSYSGLDASLGFEGARDENMGIFVDDTMQFISQVSHLLERLSIVFAICDDF